MNTSPKTVLPLRVLAALLALVLVAAACGGDDPSFEGGGFEGDDSVPDADDGSGDDDAGGDDGGAGAGGDDATDTDGTAAGDDASSGDDGAAPEPTPTAATGTSLPDPLPASSFDVGQPTSEDAVFVYVAVDLGVAYVGDCRNLDPADYETGTYCSVKDGNSYAIGQAPDLTEAVITVVEGGDGWVVDSAVLN